MANQVLEYIQSRIGQDLGEFSPPFTKWLGGIIVSITENEVAMDFTVRTEMTNPLQLLHGGVHAAIIDEMIGLLVACQDMPNFFVSINLSVDHLNKARLDETVRATARIVKRGSKVINGYCEIRNTEGVILSSGTSNLVDTGKSRGY